MKTGDRVKFIGCTENQYKWGSCTNPNGILKIGHYYQVEDIEVHSWHTKITLVGIEGKFNSVSFEDLSLDDIGAYKEMLKAELADAIDKQEQEQDEQFNAGREEALSYAIVMLDKIKIDS